MSVSSAADSDNTVSNRINLDAANTIEATTKVTRDFLPNSQSAFTEYSGNNSSSISSSISKLPSGDAMIVDTNDASGVFDDDNDVAMIVRDSSEVKALTLHIIDTYTKCNPSFKPVDRLPQRVLTNPSQANNTCNDGYDNDEANLICRVNDRLISKGYTYTILDLLGTGTFGQVFKCQKEGTKEVYAVKVIKNKPAYHNQGLLEIKIARLLNNSYDQKDEKHIVRLLEHFEYKNHICLVFELLSMSILDILTQNQFLGLSLSVVQRFTQQILAALVTFQEANIVHCDLKPENILLVPHKTPKKRPSESFQCTDATTTTTASTTTTTASTATTVSSSATTNNTTTTATNDDTTTASSSRCSTDPTSKVPSPSKNNTTDDSKRGLPERRMSETDPLNVSNRLGIWSDVKVIDLGSACFEGRTIYSYIQSRFYRSPEILLGVPYNGAIDTWSLACVCAEMYLGLPLFPGISQFNQITRIVEMLGMPPDFLIEGKNGPKYFTRNTNTTATATTGSNSSNSSNSSDNTSNGNTSGSSGKSHFKNGMWSGSDGSDSNSRYRLKTTEEYAHETKTDVPVLKKYLRYTRLDDVILRAPLANKLKLTPEQKKMEIVQRLCFLDFLKGLFKLNPFDRWSAKQAATHPFITNAAYTGAFIPLPDPKIAERKLSYLVQTQQKSISIINSSSSSSSANGSKKSAIPQQSMYNYSSNSSSNTSSSSSSSSSSVDNQFSPLFRRNTEPIQSVSVTGGRPVDQSRPSLQRGKPVHASGLLAQADAPRTRTGSNSSDIQGSTNIAYQQQQPYNQRVHHQASSLPAPMHVLEQQYPVYSSACIAIPPSHGPVYLIPAPGGIVISHSPSSLSSPMNQYRSHSLQMPHSHHHHQQQQQQQQQQHLTNSYEGNSGGYFASITPQQVQHQQPHYASSYNPTYHHRGSPHQSYSCMQQPAMTDYSNSVNTSYDVSSSVSNNSFQSIGSSMSNVGGSMQDINAMTDFGQALLRPELDERRMMLSTQYTSGLTPLMQQQQQYYWHNGSIAGSPQVVYHGNNSMHGNASRQQQQQQQHYTSGNSNRSINSNNRSRSNSINNSMSSGNSYNRSNRSIAMATTATATATTTTTGVTPDNTATDISKGTKSRSRGSKSNTNSRNSSTDKDSNDSKDILDGWDPFDIHGEDEGEAAARCDDLDSSSHSDIA